MYQSVADGYPFNLLFNPNFSRQSDAFSSPTGRKDVGKIFLNLPWRSVSHFLIPWRMPCCCSACYRLFFLHPFNCMTSALTPTLAGRFASLGAASLVPCWTWCRAMSWSLLPPAPIPHSWAHAPGRLLFFHNSVMMLTHSSRAPQ